MIEIVTVHTCDLPHDKPREGETVRFDYGSHQYELELCASDKQALATIVNEYAPYARKTGSRRRARNRKRSADIRAWAQSAGIKVNAKGRIPETLIAQYDARVTSG